MWHEAVPDVQTLQALAELARDTAYVGHSSSLTRCRFAINDVGEIPQTSAPDRWVYPGRFAELRREFEAGRRPQPGASITPPATPSPVCQSMFDGRWLVLEHIDGDMPDIRAAALVSKAIRRALLSGYGRRGEGDRIPEVVSGHDSAGNPSRETHLAIVPLSFAGVPYADGHVLGFALVPPQGGGLLEDDGFLAVLRELAPVDATVGRRVLRVTTETGPSSDRALSVALAPVVEPSRRSLDPEVYATPSSVFASVTPIVLDRHLKKQGEARQADAAAQVVEACRRIGLPEPAAVFVDKHSAVEGAPSAYPSGNAPAWTRWRLPESLRSRQLTHAVIYFWQPVWGPVLLGAGRYVGLGLCRPIDRDQR